MIKVVKFTFDLVSKMDTFTLGLNTQTRKFSDLLSNLSTRDCKSSPKLIGHSDK